MTYPPVVFTTPEETMKAPEMVIYKDGETHIQTTVSGDMCDYTEYTVSEYLDKLGPDYKCIPFDDALDLIRVAEDTKYINAWVEVSADRWEEMLCVLPPMRWQHVGGVEFFQISERLTGNLTATFARVQMNDETWKHFEANRRTSDSYDTLRAEILATL